MGVLDHFYQNSAFDAGISMHYVNLTYYCFLKEKPVLTADEQHDNLSRFDLVEINK